MALPDRVHARDPSLDVLPTFDLSFGLDDLEAPTRVTVYAEPDEEITTHWITVDAAHAVDLAQVA